MIPAYKSIVEIDTAGLIRLVRSALSKIDPRLIDHGERVGYIASMICKESADMPSFDFSRLFILCGLHDIGAYKTDEIDDMVRFETEKVFDHSVYGYLFLKNTPHLSEYAEAILYHHTDYTSPALKRSKCRSYAELIHLADRADILFSAGKSNLQPFRALSGTKFNPDYVEALCRAEEKYSLSQNIFSGAYRHISDQLIASIEMQRSDMFDYLKLLVYAIDFRSPYTVTHTADTTIISLETGKLLGLDAHSLQSLYIGAFLHDVGKIAIPHAILEKPGKLTPEEYEIVKQHIPEGEQILRGAITDEIADIALRHHEKMNGSGYSKGLSGEQLTLPQRIVAVADILSALSRKRSYKEPFPKDKVLFILNDMKQKGEICPQVTDTVCTNYDRILCNTDKSNDPVKTLYQNLVSEYNALMLSFNAREGAR